MYAIYIYIYININTEILKIVILLPVRMKKRQSADWDLSCARFLQLLFLIILLQLATQRRFMFYHFCNSSMYNFAASFYLHLVANTIYTSSLFICIDARALSATLTLATISD